LRKTGAAVTRSILRYANDGGARTHRGPIALTSAGLRIISCETDAS